MIEDEIQAEHVRRLYGKATAPIAAHLITAVATASVLWQTEELHGSLGLIAWLSAIVVASILRGYSLQRFRQTAFAHLSWRGWAAIGVAFTGVLGLIWGAGILAFFDMHDLNNAMILTVVPVGIIAAATATNAPVPAAYYVMEAPITGALCLVTWTSGTPVGHTISVLMLLTAWLRIRICRDVHSAIDQSLRVGFENLELRREAERANAAKSRFLAAASHDLRQPIHALGLSFSALTQQIQAPETAPLTRQVERCIEAVQQMLEALLDISKLDAGVVRPECASTDLGELLRRIEVELAPIARTRGNRLRVRLGRVTAVHTDPGMLECILRNLIGNALRYTENGRVLVSARRCGDGVRVGVWDTGIGIPKTHLQEIFVEFRQLGNPQRDRNQGLGLGLAIVKRLAALLDHPLGVSSEPGRGSHFWIQLPAAAAPMAEHAVATAQERTAPASKAPDQRILVLDDDRAVREAMESLLPTWGYRVLSVDTLAQALALDSAEAFDALVVDYRLPDGMTGAQAIDALQRQRGATIPVLLITGDTAPDRLRQAKSLGLPLLHKPVKPARLRAALSHLCAPQRPSDPAP